LPRRPKAGVSEAAASCRPGGLRERCKVSNPSQRPSRNGSTAPGTTESGVRTHKGIASTERATATLYCDSRAHMHARLATALLGVDSSNTHSRAIICVFNRFPARTCANGKKIRVRQLHAAQVCSTVSTAVSTKIKAYPPSPSRSSIHGHARRTFDRKRKGWEHLETGNAGISRQADSPTPSPSQRQPSSRTRLTNFINDDFRPQTGCGRRAKASPETTTSSYLRHSHG
jgi:hypothetical protein